MTDLINFTNLLDKWGVPYEQEEESYGTTVSLESDWRDSAKVRGYAGFVTVITFDKDGGFYTLDCGNDGSHRLV
jgi:hypothetical protein